MEISVQCVESGASTMVEVSDDETVDSLKEKALLGLRRHAEVAEVELQLQGVVLAEGDVSAYGLVSGCIVEARFGVAPATYEPVVVMCPTSMTASGDVMSVALSPCHRFLASGAVDCFCAIWDTATGQFIDSLADHTKGIATVLWPEPGVLVTRQHLGNVGLFDTATWDLKQAIHGQWLAVAVHTDTVYVASWTDLECWGKTPQGLYEKKCATTLPAGYCTALVASRCGTKVYSGGASGVIRWDVAEDQVGLTLRCRGVDRAAVSLCLSPCGQRLYAAGGVHLNVTSYTDVLDVVVVVELPDGLSTEADMLSYIAVSQSGMKLFCVCDGVWRIDLATLKVDGQVTAKQASCVIEAESAIFFGCGNTICVRPSSVQPYSTQRRPQSTKKSGCNCLVS